MTEEQNSFLAEKLIKRLESVGMRTSYRELYDIFLSKTTNCRPIGLVFRRWKNRGGVLMNANSPTTMTMKSITDEFEWSTDFLQGLSIKCREYEFEMKVPLELGTTQHDNNDNSNKKNNSKLTTFLPRPNVNTTPDNSGLFANYVSGLFDNLSLLYRQCGDGDALVATRQRKQQRAKKGNDDFLSNRTLCSLVEQSMGLIFLRRVATTSTTSNDKKTKKSSTLGSGFALVRKSEGSWSAPCFLSILSSKDKFTDPPSTNETTTKLLSDDVKMIVIRKKELVNNLILGNVVKFSVRKEERANVLVRDAAFIGLQDGRFILTSDFFLAVKVNDVQNQGAYSLSTDRIEASDILTGKQA